MLIQEGKGWRFGVDRRRSPFSVLIGSEHWAAELTLAEAREFRDGALSLAAELARLQDRLMEEESISLELERGQLWLELEACAGDLALRFVLRGEGQSRGIEGGWTAGATAAVLALLAQLDPDDETARRAGC